ncbi:MAG: class I SAM-dependent methyltransferase [Anaerolineales bacterium]|nr:class I SAM-dependent methyltransferase [Anaerolineales bacterium]
MKTNSTIIQDRQSARGYDDQARKANWFGPEVVFGLAYEFVKPGDSLLDLGIGSGLSSILFHKAGLQVFGLDGSSEALEVCKSKGFTAGLKEHDLRDLPLPYPSRFCNHIVSIAVLNSFKDLDGLFQEIARIIRPGGIFAFTVEEQKPGQEDRYAINRVEVSEKPKEETAVMLFRHSTDYVTRLLDQNRFTLLKTLEFVAFKYPAENRDIFFKAYIARKE